LRKVASHQLLWIETIHRYQPAKAARCDPSDTADDSMAAAEFLIFPVKQCNESLANLAEANDAEVIGSDCRFSW
jgi:hypothetical protein